MSETPTPPTDKGEQKLDNIIVEFAETPAETPKQPPHYETQPRNERGQFASSPKQPDGNDKISQLLKRIETLEQERATEKKMQADTEIAQIKKEMETNHKQLFDEFKDSTDLGELRTALKTATLIRSPQRPPPQSPPEDNPADKKPIDGQVGGLNPETGEWE